MNKEDTNTLTPTTPFEKAWAKYWNAALFGPLTIVQAKQTFEAGWNAHASLTDEWIPPAEIKTLKERARQAADEQRETGHIFRPIEKALMDHTYDLKIRLALNQWGCADDTDPWEDRCPDCTNTRREGHKLSCELARAIGKFESSFPWPNERRMHSPNPA